MKKSLLAVCCAFTALFVSCASSGGQKSISKNFADACGDWNLVSFVKEGELLEAPTMISMSLDPQDANSFSVYGNFGINTFRGSLASASNGQLQATSFSSTKSNEEFKRKHARHKMCSLEELKYRVMGKTGLSFNKINELSVRQFTKLVESLEAISSYELNMVLAPNMEKKDQQNIVHWLASVDKKKNAIEDNSISLDEMKNKLQA